MDYEEYVEYLETVPYSIYKITNVVNNKIYIGITKDPINIRWSKHVYTSKKGIQNKFMNAIRKYGRDSFQIECIDNCIGFSNACRLEIKYIEQFDSYNKGYNSTYGGQGVPGGVWAFSDGSREILSKRMSDYHASKNPIDRLQKPATRKKQSAAKLNKKHNPVTVNGVEYNSIRAAARALNSSFYLIQKHLETGCEIKTTAKKFIDRYYYIAGLEFETREHAAKFFRVSIHNLKSAVRRYEKLGILEEMIKKFEYESNFK